MTNRLFLTLASVLLLVRLPSIVEPMGGDQGLYAYVGDRILAGELPYRDAWDQKPPAVHYVYAAMRAAWPSDSAVAAADLLAAAVVSALLYALGTALVTQTTGCTAALLFLALSNPAFLRLSGVAVRAQCETFISACVAGALLLTVRARDSDARPLIVAGALVGLAFAFKYNAAVYGLVAVLVLIVRNRFSLRAAGALVLGFCIPVTAVIAAFAMGHALRDLYAATVMYNLRYSGQTYAGPLHAIGYLLTFPVRHARVDGLWLIGGAGCAVLLVAARWNRGCLVGVAWVGAACLSIAINGSRELPQYFIQAAPALALAAAWAGTLLWTKRRPVNLAAALAVAFAIWRVNDFSKLADNTRHDAAYMFGRIDRTEHLARYGDRTVRKYSALAVAQLGEFLRTRTSPPDRVYVFGFSCGAYVEAQRASASRFSWSRPVIVGFNDGIPGYGVAGLLDDFKRTPPAVVALQVRDWAPDVDDSAHFFMTNAALSSWLRASYDQVEGPEGYDVWTKRSVAR
jgi:hypothetical protein